MASEPSGAPASRDLPLKPSEILIRASFYQRLYWPRDATNLDFAEWSTVFGEAKMTTALLTGSRITATSWRRAMKVAASRRRSPAPSGASRPESRSGGPTLHSPTDKASPRPAGSLYGLCLSRPAGRTSTTERCPQPASRNAGLKPWVKVQSAGWVHIGSARTAHGVCRSASDTERPSCAIHGGSIMEVCVPGTGTTTI
jgi:hypothetical protein